MRSPDELTDLFRSTGRKVTAQRQCIFRVLQGDVTHPSAEAVYDVARAEMETISLKTVYQTLYELAELGEVEVLDVGTGTTRFDPNVESAFTTTSCAGPAGRFATSTSTSPASRVPARGLMRGSRWASAEVVFRGLVRRSAVARRTRRVARRGRRSLS
jgi:Fe2+ or Zn2+ uptake regulation protein